MSDVRLVIRDAQCDISGFCHSRLAQRTVAALRDDPETFAELRAALRRFEFDAGGDVFGGFRPGLADRPEDAGIVIIGVAARLVVYESPWKLPYGNCRTWN